MNNPLSEVDHDMDGTSYFGCEQAPAEASPSLYSDTSQGYKTEAIEFEHYW